MGKYIGETYEEAMKKARLQAEEMSRKHTEELKEENAKFLKLMNSPHAKRFTRIQQHILGVKRMSHQQFEEEMEKLSNYE